MNPRQCGKLRRSLASILFLGFFLSPLCGLQGQEARRDPASGSLPRPMADLRAVLDTGVVLQDRNGDRVVDDLDAGILLGPNPGQAELAAASNIAARLGYETSATDLGLAERAGSREGRSRPVILVGREAVDAAGIQDLAADGTAGLSPGQGVLARVPPGTRTPQGGVAVLGYDASGLLAAASYLAARYPQVWATDGADWHQAADRVEAFARGKGVVVDEAALDRIVVDEARPGVARARMTLRVSGSVDFQHAVNAFQGLDTKADTLNENQTAGGQDASGAGGAQPDEAQTKAQGPSTLADLEVAGLHRLDVRIVGPGDDRTITLRPGKPWGTREDGAFRAGADATFSLSGIFDVGGLFRDTNRDLVPDETAAYLSLTGYDAGSGFDASAAVVDLATRIGLETAGIRLPLVRVDGQEDDPTSFGFPIFLGSDHYQIQRLFRDGRLVDAGVPPGVGFVQFVSPAFGERNALAVGGGDEAGWEAGARWLTRSAPYLWRYGKGEYHLRDVETEVRRFLQAREAPGQLALALTKLESWLDRMAQDPPTRLELELTALDVPQGTDSLLERAVRARFPETELAIRSWPTGFGVGDTVFVQDWEIPWEVDEVRTLLDQQVYTDLRRGAPATIEIRVSEPPEVRAALAEEIREALGARGVPDATVHVLSAYKQGYSWINDVLLPRLRGEPVAAIDLIYHTLEESEEVRWQTIAAETRWLQEVYPIDAVLARELGTSDSAVTFHPTRSRNPIYTFEARDAEGGVLLHETFDPKYVVRPFFDLFPEYEQVRVTTGWLTAVSGGDTLVDRRIVTDPERFWDRMQTETYGAIIDYVMDTQDGDPSGDNAPYFDEFRVDLRMSEPDYRIGIDEETISSLEALHEDIFFETHTLFSLLGARYQTSLSYPGRVLPFVDPSGAGRPGTARLSLTGKEKAGPRLVMRSWTGDGMAPRLREYDLSPLPVDPPGLEGVTVASGEEGLRRLLLRVTVPDSVDRFADFEGRSSEGDIDRQFLNVQLLEGMLSSLRRFHEAGMLEGSLAWDRVDELALDFRLEKDSVFRALAVLPRSAHPASTDNPRLDAGTWTYAGEPLVQWETPIPPAENEEILARLSTFPEVNAYYLTDSYLGHRVWAADVLPPQPGAYVSQAKLNALKPTLFVSGREHANEVSSTSHILRLGELLVTDSTHRALLNRVNVVLHPMTNPDGAQLAYERQLVNPDHMLHAGRPGALGVDATSGGGSDDPVYPEARARTMIREAWLPDIYLNPHGYPSHEWVQYFAGYSAWARGRRVGARAWWVPRGWFIPGFSWVDDEENPDYKTAQFAILDSIAAAMTGNEAVDALNRRLYARYKKYGEQDREGFTEYLHNGMVVDMSLRGAESIRTGVSSPRITYFSVTTEAPDETARGSYLDLMGQAGLAHTTAALRYLANGKYDVKREAEAFDGVVTRKLFRVKPVMPPGEGDGEAGGGG